MSKQERQQRLARLWQQMLREDPYDTGYGRRNKAAALLGVHPITLKRDLQELRATVQQREG